MAGITSTAGMGGEAVGGHGGADDSGGEGGVGGAVDTGDETTCVGAARIRSHLGCEFWPTLVANPAWSDFTPGLKLANPGADEVEVEITGPNGFHKSVTLLPREAQSVKLAWVPELKGVEAVRSGDLGQLPAISSSSPAAAYKVTSSSPIAVWQLSPLEIEIPGDCNYYRHNGRCGARFAEGSLLLPATSLTGNYRVMSLVTRNQGDYGFSSPGAFAVTAVKDGTTVQVLLASRCAADTAPQELGACTSPGSDIATKSAGESYTFKMNAGDVTTLVGLRGAVVLDADRNADLSGTLVSADQPVQVISFAAAAYVPDPANSNTAHLEETVPPLESFGKKYAVMPPSAPAGRVGHLVRIYGTVDGTKLQYPNGKPNGAPDVINAGEVAQISPFSPFVFVRCDSDPWYCLTDKPFTIEASEPIGVASLLPSDIRFNAGQNGGINNDGNSGTSWVLATEQFRQSYALTVPDGTMGVADVLVASGAKVFLDGSPLSLSPDSEIGGWQQLRLNLDVPGLHEVRTDSERGMSVQLHGYAQEMGFYYPAGGNFKLLSEPSEDTR